jgi:hypothetical protein
MRPLVLFVSMSLMMACGDSGVVQPTEDSGVQDTVADTTVTVDTAPADTLLPDTTQLDTGTSKACEPGEGCFGESCASTDDCLSGICTMHLGDKVCSKTCDEACPQGWSCTLVGSGGDGQYVCMSKFSHLCLPCEGSDGCTGETPNACIKYAEGARFCGGSCDLETPCPSGYACQEVETADGANSYQCVNTAGVCPCSNLAIDSALATPCEAINEQGSCEGVRICEESGLSACSADEPVAETCNGIDDDCNGLTDEGTCDDGNDCTVDTCDGADGCKYEALTEGECLDGDACTIADHCEEGVCVGQVVDCDDGNPCTVSTCDGLGGCKHENVVAVCDDGDACTLGDLCQEGECTGSASLTCDDGNPCTDDSCGEAGCLFEANTADCDDGNACTSGDTCAGGACKGEQVVCDDKNLCTTDSCNIEIGCVNANNTQPCDDSDGCTQGDVCADGACKAGAAATCEDGNPCTDDACDGKLGCVFTPNVLDCDDKSSCTTGDGCVEGNCIGLGDLSCDDGNPCTEDACLPNGGCTNTVVAGPCDDGNACTVNDACVNGACASGLSLSCDDGNPCTGEACEGGDCVFTPADGDCDDGNNCTTESACSGGACVGTKALTCDDGNVCTNDGCDPATGCVTANNQNPCSDGSVCTLGDTCEAGACAAGINLLACDDGNVCTDDTCDGAAGCTHTPNQADCDDANACTVGDVCAKGWCNSPQTLECDDNLPCTDDSCAPATGCVHTNSMALCDDGDACTAGEKCADGACGGGLEVSCSDDNPCTDDSCDAATGCVLAPNTDPCNDGAGCTEDDVCSGGVCAGVSCEDKGLICDNAACVAFICGDGQCDADKGETLNTCAEDCTPPVWLESDEVRWYPILYPHNSYKQSTAVQVCKDAGLRLWRDEQGSSNDPNWVYDVNNSHNLGGQDIGYKVDSATQNTQQGHTGEWQIFGTDWSASIKSVTGASNGQDVYILNKQAHSGDYEDTASFTRVRPEANSVTFMQGEYSQTVNGMSYALVLCAERK